MKRRAVLMCVILVSSVMLTAAAVTAKKPEPDDGPTGSIFYHMDDDNGDLYIWTISPDGSSKSKQNPVVIGYEALSWEKHNGHYWYIYSLEVDDSTYPDGQPVKELYAIRDDDTGNFKLIIDWSYAIVPYPWNVYMWVPGDDYISWVGKRWTDNGDGTYSEGSYGIYRAEVKYAANGDVSGIGNPAFVYDTGSWYDSDGDQYYTDCQDHYWNPSGDKVAYTQVDTNLYVDSVPAGTSPTKLVQGYEPKWSPDGKKIAFTRSKEILVIDVDGTGLTSIAKTKSNGGAFKNVWAHEWSPDSKYLVYTAYEQSWNTWATKSNMYTIKADGSGESKIGGLALDEWKYSRDWR